LPFLTTLSLIAAMLAEDKNREKVAIPRRKNSY
jgi:hypothetical protein